MPKKRKESHLYTIEDENRRRKEIEEANEEEKRIRKLRQLEIIRQAKSYGKPLGICFILQALEQKIKE